MTGSGDSSALTDSDHWDRKWSGAHRIRELSPRHEYFGRRGLFMRMVRRWISDLNGATVLELGGGGLNRRLLALSMWGGAEVHALDYSPVSLELLDRLFEANGVTVTAHQGDFESFDFGGQQFDLVVHWGVLEHFSDPAPLLKLSADLVRPGGSLLLSMPNMCGPCGYFWKRWSPEGWKTHVYHPPERILKSCQRAGFVEAEEFFFGYPCVRHSKWEQQGLAQKGIDWVQTGLKTLSILVPVFHRVGGPKISMERGFFARKAKATGIDNEAGSENG